MQFSITVISLKYIGPLHMEKKHPMWDFRKITWQIAVGNINHLVRKNVFSHSQCIRYMILLDKTK